MVLHNEVNKIMNIDKVKVNKYTDPNRFIRKSKINFFTKMASKMSQNVT